MDKDSLMSSGEIAKVFGVRRSRVAEWARAGAPIAFSGGRRTASAKELMRWLAVRYAPPEAVDVTSEQCLASGPADHARAGRQARERA